MRLQVFFYADVILERPNERLDFAGYEQRLGKAGLTPVLNSTERRVVGYRVGLR